MTYMLGHMIMFGSPLGDAPSIGVLCSVYKSDVLSELGPWEKGSVTQTQQNQGHTTGSR